MSAPDFAGVYEILDHRLAAALGSEWYASQLGPDDFDNGADGAARLHRAYHLSLPDSTFASRQAGGVVVSTSFELAWLYRLRVGNRTLDYTEALKAERTILLAIMGTPGLKVTVTQGPRRTERPAETGPILHTTITGTVLHLFPLGSG